MKFVKVSLNFLEKGTGFLTFSTIEQAQSFFNAMSPFLTSHAGSPPPPPDSPVQAAPLKSFKGKVQESPKTEAPPAPQSPTLPIFKKKTISSVPVDLTAIPSKPFDASPASPTPPVKVPETKKIVKGPPLAPKEPVCNYQ
jgi:hypothetical protein